MFYSFLADIIAVFHFGFILFAVLGGIVSYWWRNIVWLHIPTALWAALIEFAGWICPLTPLENWLRVRGGEVGYSGGFVEHYILPIIYPAGLTREIQVILGTFVILVNLLIYWHVFIARNPKLFKAKKVR